MVKMYSAKFNVTDEEFFHHDLHKLFNLVVSHGIELMREYGYISKFDVVRICDDYYDPICSIHFGQSYPELGTDYASVRVRAYQGNNNKNRCRFYRIRTYKLYR